MLLLVLRGDIYLWRIHRLMQGTLRLTPRFQQSPCRYASKANHHYSLDRYTTSGCFGISGASDSALGITLMDTYLSPTGTHLLPRARAKPSRLTRYSFPIGARAAWEITWCLCLFQAARSALLCSKILKLCSTLLSAARCGGGRSAPRLSSVHISCPGLRLHGSDPIQELQT